MTFRLRPSSSPGSKIRLIRSPGLLETLLSLRFVFCLFVDFYFTFLFFIYLLISCGCVSFISSLHLSFHCIYSFLLYFLIFYSFISILFSYLLFIHFYFIFSSFIYSFIYLSSVAVFLSMSSCLYRLGS